VRTRSWLCARGPRQYYQMMSRYRRVRVAGATYFFTVATYRRQPLLTHPEVIITLRQALRSVKQRLPFHIDALVLLPNHLHAVLTLPPGDDNYTARLSLIKRHVSQSAWHLIAVPQSSSRLRRRELGF
jgi:putative transposase